MANAKVLKVIDWIGLIPIALGTLIILLDIRQSQDIQSEYSWLNGSVIIGGGLMVVGGVIRFVVMRLRNRNWQPKRIDEGELNDQ